MKKLILLSTVFFSLTIANGQTNVSGGIFSNTTWTKVNSPYVVTDTVVVFPGVTLTIQPGVTVKFADNQQLEIRQAKLIALGTKTDSITFTSTSLSPTVGIWNSIFLNGENMSSKFNYCKFLYANYGINSTPTLYSSISDSLSIKNSNFNFNNWGMYLNSYQGVSWPNTGIAFIDSCNFKNNLSYGMKLADLITATINNCYFSNNGTGLESSGYPSHINNCIFDSNQIGLSPTYAIANNCYFRYNQTGISSGAANTIKNCTIDSNSVLGISAYSDSVVNCYIRYNGEGIQSTGSVIIGNIIEYNTGDNIHDKSINLNGFAVISGNTIRYGSIGIADNLGAFTITKNIIENNTLGITLNNKNSTISCNRICNNTTYDLKYTASGNINATHNFWCTPDSVSTEVVIYDGHDNINYGLVSFMPTDSLCYLANSINEIAQEILIKLFPNPFSTSTTLQTVNLFKNATLTVYNSFGQQVNQIKNISGQTVTLFRGNLPSGLYFLRLTEDNKIISTDKLVIADN